MCGIAGLLGNAGSSHSLRSLVHRMTLTLSHRGPDGDGAWIDGSGRVALGHRRLAIIDLSEAGKQPMVSASGRYCITFNGEIYNFEHVRKELEALGHGFRGRADTEVLLASIEQWGMPAALDRLTGMFAFAVWDNELATLTLARDRLGKKPLYYGYVGGLFAFASEPKALACLPGFSDDIDRDALLLYLRHNYVPAPFSIYRDVKKLEPGSTIQISANALTWTVREPRRYWSPQDVFARAADDPYRGDLPEAAEEVEALLSDAVRLRMISDVPLGAFLSGGIDSSLVVALMQKHSSRPVRTYTVGFAESAYDEADQARAVARHLGTEHTEVLLRPEDALGVIPELPTMYDEPFADSSQIPTLLVCRSARQFVTVAVSGDGGDESFGGYNRYIWWRQLWRSSRRMPSALRPLAQRALRSVPAETWDSALKALHPMLPERLRLRSVGDRMHKLAELLGTDDPQALYKRLVSQYHDPSLVGIGGREPPTSLAMQAPGQSLDELTSHMMMLDLTTYLPDDILVKVDRASMSTSLEVRSPLLDHRIVELGARLPVPFKLSGSRGKLVLRRILDRYVPRELVDRPKTGFGVPIDSWLRGPLREWAEDLLSERALSEHGLLRSTLVRKQWSEHLAGTRAWHYPIWVILMFQAWWRTRHPGRSAILSHGEPAAGSVS
jgi:asparagine synthase (glutamine-hydrolysing)